LLVVTLRLAAGLPLAPIAPSWIGMLFARVTAPVPVEVTAPTNSLLVASRLTPAVPVATVVAPATKAAAVWLTASLLVVTLRLATGLPVAPIAPSWSGVLLTSVSAPVPVEPTGPANWLAAALRLTIAAPAATVVAPATNAAAVWLTASLLVVTLRLAAGLPLAPIARAAWRCR
jgi:hypothetical protein